MRQEVKDEFAKLRRVQWSWHSPGTFQPGDAELDLLAQVLAGNEAARLERLLVVEKQLAQDVAVYQQSNTFSSNFNIAVTLRGEADLATVEKLVTAELERVRNEPVTDRELKRAGCEASVQADLPAKTPASSRPYDIVVVDAGGLARDGQGCRPFYLNDPPRSASA